MALRITCPYCERRHELAEPYPLPGSDLHCWCGAALSISYPAGLMERLRKKGIRFQGDPGPGELQEDEFTEEEVHSAVSLETASEPLAPTSPEPKIEPQDPSLTNLPGLDNWERLPTNEIEQEPEFSSVHEDTVLMEDREAFFQDTRNQDLSTPPAPSTERPISEIPPIGGAETTSSPETTADMGKAAPARRGRDHTGEDTADMGEEAPKQKLPANTEPLEKAGSESKTRFYQKRWFKLFAIGSVVMGLLGILTIVMVFWYYGNQVPSVSELKNYQPATVTIIEDRNGKVIGEIYPVPDRKKKREERRYVRQIEQIPKHVQEAFIYAEDANFKSHGGIDYLGIIRATVFNIARGRKAQGASTITQQVARNFLLRDHQNESGTFDKSIGRKIKEMVLARRMEKAYSKDFILFLYLNEIYFGSGAYGVEAASRRYFGKSVNEITLAEAAILAGLPQAPAINPHSTNTKNRVRSNYRRRYVLNQLLQKGRITKEEHNTALNEKVRIIKTENPTKVLAPHFTEFVRRKMIETYGWEAVYQSGLVVKTTCDLDLQTQAQEAAVNGVHTADSNLGWRGPIKNLGGKEAIQAALADQALAFKTTTPFPLFMCKPTSSNEQANSEDDRSMCDPAPKDSPNRSLTKNEVYDAIVLQVEKTHAMVGVGNHQAIVPLKWSEWAKEVNPKQSWKSGRQRDMKNVLTVGDLINVEIVANNATEVQELSDLNAAQNANIAAAKLYQAPALEGALLAFDLDTGAVQAMVGGIDYSKSQYNKAIQAKRQVGSTFKPMVYSAALGDISKAPGERLTAGSLLLDAPFTQNSSGDQLWKPGGHSSKGYLGLITMRKALALSLNSVAVRIAERTGVPLITETARQLGIESLREEDYYGNAIALGTPSISMLEIARAYSTFATYGTLVEPYFIEEVRDRDERVLEQHEPVVFKQVMEPAVAGITAWLLREVARRGTGRAASYALPGLALAGKTGTTNDYFDAWFVGFSPDIVVATWVGYDKPKSMGYGSDGASMALPIWIDYMRAAYPNGKSGPFAPIPDVTFHEIDETNGRVVASGGKSIPFVPETVPTGPVVEIGQQSTEDLLSVEF